MTDDRETRATDAPVAYATARRPGQSGAETERRPGPSPLSANPTGPHAPYEPEDPEGLAAAKHARDPAATAKPPDPEVGKKSGLGEDFKIVG